MIKHGNGYKFDPQTLYQVRDLLTDEVYRCGHSMNSFVSEQEALEYVEAHKAEAHRLVIVKFECLIYRAGKIKD